MSFTEPMCLCCHRKTGKNVTFPDFQIYKIVLPLGIKATIKEMIPKYLPLYSVMSVGHRVKIPFLFSLMKALLVCWHLKNEYHLNNFYLVIEYKQAQICVIL